MPLNKQAILEDIFRNAPPLNSEDDCAENVVILEKAIRLLKPETGRLLVILPHGVASGVSETEVRNIVKANTHIHACISLPVGAFKPFGGSNARTCVLNSIEGIETIN